MFQTPGSRSCAAAAVAAGLFVLGRPAAGQVVSGDRGAKASRPVQAPASDSSRGWEVEGYGGLALVRLSRTGTSNLPPPGASLPTSSPLFPTREVPSWLFGDGAVLLNDTVAAFGRAEAIVPLDGLFTSLGLEPETGGAFGLRIRRQVTSRYAAELGLDVITGDTTLTDELLAGLDATRASFGAAFDALLETGPFANSDVRATAAALDGSGRSVAVTGAVVYRFVPGGSIDPHVTLGGGLLVPSGDAGSMTIDGSYRMTAGAVPFDETDHVTLRYEHPRTWIGVVGGGVSRTMAGGWGLRVDGRVLLGPNRTRLLVSASPDVPIGAPAGFIGSGTNPSVQFSNDPATGRRSSLSAPALADFTVFEGDGLTTRVLVTVGAYWKF